MNRKKSLFFSLLIIFSFTPNLFSQEIAPFQLEDVHAKTLNKAVVDQIVGKKWVCINRKFTKGSSVKNSKIRLNFNLNKNGIFSQNEKEGDWSLEDNLLNLQIELEPFQNSNIYMAGGFSVYRITEEELILAKNLSSQFDNKIVYYFELEEKIKAREKDFIIKRISKNDTSSSPISEPFRKEMPKNKDDIINYLKPELFMRNVRLEKGLDKMSMEELKQLWDSIYRMPKEKKFQKIDIKKETPKKNPKMPTSRKGFILDLNAYYYIEGNRPNDLNSLSDEELKKLWKEIYLPTHREDLRF